MKKSQQPPQWINKFLQWRLPEDQFEEVQGDMQELYEYWVEEMGERKARWMYLLNAFTFLRPLPERPASFQQKMNQSLQPNPFVMFSNYLKIAFRNIVKQKVYSFINLGGLAIGMTVAMLIGLWMWDELSFNKYHQHYDRIAQVYHRSTSNGEVRIGGYSPLPLGNELRTAYREDFKYVVLSSWTEEHILAFGDKKLTKAGNFLSPDGPELLTLKMLKGSRAGLQDPSSILLSQSTAQALFGDKDPIGKIIKIDNTLPLKVTGVYEDLPYNTSFHEMTFIAPWDLYVSSQGWVKQLEANWGDHSFQILLELAPNAHFDIVSQKMKHVKLKHNPDAALYKSETFLHPMSRWHLYSEWDKAGNGGGRIQYVWLFGIIGVFVLLLACINFMNLTTARSSTRAKEVGIRKTIGSLRTQLMSQFLSESLLMAGIAFVVSLLLVLLLLPLFNQVADKRISMLWTSPLFWLFGIGFTLLTGLIAGSYPAFYLSSFGPVKVLKGTFRTGRFSAIPRKVLVVVQFTVSVTLIIGTVFVFRQIQYAKDRPIGYDRNGLITVPMNTPELRGGYNALRSELLATGAILEMSTSSSAATDLGYRSGGFEWPGKDPDFKDDFGVTGVTHDFGKTVGWQFIQGRDFSRQFSTDSTGIILNETAVNYMGLQDPVGKIVKFQGQNYQVLGIIKDMVMESPFEVVKPGVFLLSYGWASVINLKLNPGMSARQSLDRIEAVFLKLNPGSPFDFNFIDQEYGAKFATEERIGKLASGFTILAVFISCLGLFGLISFIAEQRRKEIGVRKVLGATTFNLWGLLSKEFVGLVLIAFFMATPIAYYFLQSWLKNFEYRTTISPWVFVLSGLGTLLITLFTISYQAIRAALANPVRSLRNE